MHIAGPYLENVGVGAHHRHRLDIDHLGDDLQAGLLPGLGQHLQALLLQALEGVRRRPRLVRPAPQELRAAILDRLSGLQQLFAALHRARPGHNHQALAAHRHAADVDDAALVLELAADQLVALGHGHDLLHPRQHLHREAVDDLLVADHADNRAISPLRQMHFQAEAGYLLHDAVDVHVAGMRLHYDDHDFSSPVLNYLDCARLSMRLQMQGATRTRPEAYWKYVGGALAEATPQMDLRGSLPWENIKTPVPVQGRGLNILPWYHPACLNI